MKKATTILIALGAACAMMLGVYGAFWFVTFAHSQQAEPIICGTNISGLAKSMIVYANDDPNGRLPPADKWCDLLVTLLVDGWRDVSLHLDDTSPRQFVCLSSDAVEGESSYAINKHIAGKSLDNIPQNVVLLFETDQGRDPNGRNELLKNRRFCAKMPFYGEGETKVFKDRWNQSGGAEILTTQHHGGKGCNVVFVDTHVEFVKTEDLEKLNWGQTEAQLRE